MTERSKPTLVALGTDAAPALAEVHALALAKPWTAAELARTMAGSGAFTIAAMAGDACLGFVTARALAGEAEILTLAVLPRHRRGGVGRALVEAAAATATANGAGVIWLEVAEHNAAAKALYGGAGFEVSGRRARYYADGSDAVLMRRVLNT